MSRWMRAAAPLRAAALAFFAFALGACGGTSVVPNAGQAVSGISTTGTNGTTSTSDPVAFSASNYAVNQGTASVTVTVTRSGDSTDAISVDYATADGSAIAGTDYTAAGGTLFWAENDSTPQSITILVSSAAAFSGTRSFSIALGNPSVAAEIGSPGSATITITGAASLGTVGTLQLADAAYTVAQNAQLLTVTVNRIGGATGATSVAYATSDGTAIAGIDYTAASGTLAWNDGDADPKSFTVAISGATPFVGAKTFGVTLSAPTGGAALGTPASATVTIIGDASAPIGSFALSSANYSVAQNAGAVTVTVDRLGGSSGAASVAYATAAGTAVAGTDYTRSSGTLDWADGDAAPKSFTVPVSNATPFTGSVTFTVNLSNPSPGATIVNPGSATVTIAGDAEPPVGALVLSASSYSVAQNGGAVTVSVHRVGGSSGAVSVAYQTANGSAAAGTDFTAEKGTLDWNDGETAPKSFTVPISNATPFSGTKSFTVSLSAPSAGAAIGAPKTAIVTIVGDAVVAAVGDAAFAADAYSVDQSAGSITVAVNRIGGASGAITVAYATSNGSAAAGTDYTAASGTLAWANGDAAAKTVTVRVNSSPAFSGSKTFGIALSTPTGGAGIANPGSATVTIAGDAPPPVGSLALSAGSYSVAQNGGTVTVTVNRVNGSNGAASVNYGTNGGTAVAGTEFTAASGTLSWAAGDSDPKSFTIAISNTVPFAGTKTFSVALSNPGAGATIGNPASAIITIVGDAAGGPIFWVYHDGFFAWGGDYSTAAVPNYKSTAGDPESGSYDIAVSLTGRWGLWAPYAGGTVPVWNFNDTGYNYIIMDLKPTVPNQVWTFYFMQVHDVEIIGENGKQTVLNLADYGPAPQVGVWGTYRIPLSLVLTQWAGGSPVYETSVYKFGLQDETGLAQNTWYVDNVGFSP